jgi:sterol desaturase/sphingolipid hydroxylase (fatty acid hydroxylase superfamily)
VNTFIGDYGWLLVFWGTLILLGAVEYLAPETPGDCDEHLDATSTLRNHPLELIASAVFVGAIVAISGLSPAVLIVYESIEALLNLLAHANVRLPQPAERVARALFFIAPTLHRIHHSARQEETDSNYGAVFSFWDHLFGTYRDKAAELQAFRFGLDEISRKPRKASKLNWRCPGDPSYLFVRR